MAPLDYPAGFRLLIGAGDGVGIASESTADTATDETATDATSEATATETDVTSTPGDPDAGAKKALDAERAARKAVEKELAGIKKAQEKAAEEARIAKLSDDEKRDEVAKTATERAETAEAKAAVLEACIEHGITDKADRELLSSLPADQVEAVAKRIAADAKPAPAGRSGNPVGGAKPKSKPTTLDGAIGAFYA